MDYLFDTNHCAYLMNGSTKPPSKQKPEDINVYNRVSRLVTTANFYLCTIVLGELYYGAYNSDQVADNLNRIALLKTRFTTLDVDEDLFRFYGMTRASFNKKGIKVENFDLTIACIAMYNNLTLLSNDHIFDYLKPDLSVDNWAV
jgi:tRNA(fMet)-specific endonuclease VapC